MAYVTVEKSLLVLRPPEDQYVAREGYETWTAAKITWPLKPGEKMTLNRARPGPTPHSATASATFDLERVRNAG